MVGAPRLATAWALWLGPLIQTLPLLGLGGRFSASPRWFASHHRHGAVDRSPKPAAATPAAGALAAGGVEPDSETPPCRRAPIPA